MTAGGKIEREDDWCSVAYWYMDKPVNTLPPIQPLEERIADLPPKEK